MIICENKTQSVVLYKFNNGNEKRYKASHALDVETLSNTSADNKKCYRIDYVNLSGVSGTSYVCSSSLVLVPIEGTTYIWIKDAEGRFSQSSATEKSATLTIVSNADIPEGQCLECIGNSCSIAFKDLQGNILYRETGECPITWKYSCDDECPEGFLKCECDEYPGYCCMPCSPILNRLSTIENKISSLIKQSI